MTEEENRTPGTLSRSVAKQTIGRSFVTTKHEGQSGAHMTEWAASERLKQKFSGNKVSDREWETLNEDWGSTIRSIQSAQEPGKKLSREEIRDIIDDMEKN